MENKKTSVFNNALIWFGAGVSIAEIVTGTSYATFAKTNGISNCIWAIIIGHVIGCCLLFLAGFIGAVSRKSSMETTGYSFGKLGAKFFAVLNVIQLVGWTGIMIYQGAGAVNSLFDSSSAWIWALVIGALIIVWILIGITNLGILNKISMTALFILTIVICKVVFFGKQGAEIVTGDWDVTTFGAAVELAVAMPLSWLPLISDYTKDAEKPLQASLASAVTYGVVSCWMYIIGMGAAVYAGNADIAQIMKLAGLGSVALVVIILSTVTTTFLDAYSAGFSGQTIISKLSPKWTGIAVAVLGTIGACLFNMESITDFLYYIGSVFAPMIAILLADFFVVKEDNSEKLFSISGLIIWAAGFALYRYFMTFNMPTGYTIPDMAATLVLAIIVGLIKKSVKSSE